MILEDTFKSEKVLYLIIIRTRVYAHTYIMLHKPFTLFTFPMKSGIFAWKQASGEGGEGFREHVACIGKDVSEILPPFGRLNDK